MSWSNRSAPHRATSTFGSFPRYSVWRGIYQSPISNGSKSPLRALLFNIKNLLIEKPSRKLPITQVTLNRCFSQIRLTNGDLNRFFPNLSQANETHNTKGWMNNESIPKINVAGSTCACASLVLRRKIESNRSRNQMIWFNISPLPRLIKLFRERLSCRHS